MRQSSPIVMVSLLLGLVGPLMADKPVEDQDASEQVGARGSILDTLALSSDFQQTAALYELLSQADVEDLRFYIDEAYTIANPSDRRAGLSIIYNRYLDLDPEGALDHQLNAGHNTDRSVFYSLFYSWSKIDLEGAITHSRGLATTVQQQVARQAILKAHEDQGLGDLEGLSQRLGGDDETTLAQVQAASIMELARTDPQAAVEQALALDNAELRSRLLPMIAGAWAASDPAAALKFSTGIASRNDRGQFRQSVLSVAAQRQPPLALAWLQSGLLSREEDQVVISQVFSSLARTDAQRGLRLAGELENATYREQAYGSLIGIMAHYDAQQAVALLDSIDDPSLMSRYGSQVAQGYAKSDPDAAFEWASSRGADRYLQQQTVINAVAGEDPEKALEMIARIPSSPVRLQALAGFIQQVSSKDPAEAAAYLELLPPSQAKTNAARNIAQHWLGLDAAGAVAWILQQEGQLQRSMLSSASWQLAQHDIELAKSILPEIPGGKIRDQWMRNIVSHMASQNPSEAAVWLEQFVGEPAFTESLFQVIYITAQSDFEGALLLAEQLENPDDYRRAMADAVTIWAQHDPYSARRYVEDISDPELQAMMLPNLASHLGQYDSEDALRWLMRFESSAGRDEALLMLTSNDFISDADISDIISAISSESLRQQAVSNYIRRTAQIDASAARGLLDKFSIQGEARQHLLDAIEQAEQGNYGTRVVN